MFSPLIPWSRSIGRSCPSGLIIQMLNLKKWSFFLYFLSYFVVFFVLLPGIFSQLYLPTFHIRLILCASFLSFSIFEGVSLPTYYALQTLLLLLTLKIFSQELLPGFLIILFHGTLFCFCVVIISQFFLSILKIHFKKSIFFFKINK